MAVRSFTQIVADAEALKAQREAEDNRVVVVLHDKRAAQALADVLGHMPCSLAHSLGLPQATDIDKGYFRRGNVVAWDHDNGQFKLVG